MRTRLLNPQVNPPVDLQVNLQINPQAGPAPAPVLLPEPPRPRPAPRGAAAALACGLLALAGGCDPIDFSGIGFAIRADQTLVEIAEPVQVRSPDGGCVPRWSVTELPSGLSSRGATLSGGGRAVTFTAREAGTYRVTGRCGKTEASQQITVFKASATLGLHTATPLPFKCQDATAGPRGRLLCVDHGVHVVDPATGTELGKTADPVPASWGLDVQGDRFAVTTLGCDPAKSACPAGGAARGLYLYRLGPDDKPVRLAQVPEAGELLPLLAGDRAFVTTADTLRRFDLTDETRPAAAGCVRDRGLGSIPVPLLAGGRLAVLSWQNTLLVYDPERLPASCDTPAPPLSRLKLSSAQSAVFYARPVLSGDLAYVTSTDALTTLDLRDPLRPAATTTLDRPTRAAALHDGKLLALTDKALIALDLTDPRSPRPVGQLRLATTASQLDRVVAADGKAWLVQGGTLQRVEFMR